MAEKHGSKWQALMQEHEDESVYFLNHRCKTVWAECGVRLDSLSPARFFLLKFLWPLETSPLTGGPIVKYRSCSFFFSLSNNHAHNTFTQMIIYKQNKDRKQNKTTEIYPGENRDCILHRKKSGYLCLELVYYTGKHRAFFLNYIHGN